MKWVLIASMLNMQPVYDDQATCITAAEEIRKVYYQEAAVCIPMPEGDLVDRKQNEVFERFFNMVERLQDLETQRQKELDKFLDDAIIIQ